jgi:hypothetical protein
VVFFCFLRVLSIIVLFLHLITVSSSASTNLDLSQLNSDPVTSYRNAVLPVYYPDSPNTRNVLYQDQEKISFSPGTFFVFIF